MRSAALLTSLAAATLAVTARAAHADDTAQILDDGVTAERTRQTENAASAAASGALLGYESVRLIINGYETKPSGGYIDLSGLGETLDYTFGVLTGLGSLTMLGLAIYDLGDTPVADARASFRTNGGVGNPLPSGHIPGHLHEQRYISWFGFTVSTLLSGWGLYMVAAGGQDEARGRLLLWAGGTGDLVYGTLLLHTREPVATETRRRLVVGFTGTGIAASGTF